MAASNTATSMGLHFSAQLVHVVFGLIRRMVDKNRIEIILTNYGGLSKRTKKPSQGTHLFDGELEEKDFRNDYLCDNGTPMFFANLNNWIRHSLVRSLHHTHRGQKFA